MAVIEKNHEGKVMPAYVLTCPSCGRLRSFFLHDLNVSELEREKYLKKPCPICKTQTNWMFTFQERRSGRDRRSGLERRGAEPYWAPALRSSH